MLQNTPGAIGAVFLDREGEAVDLFAEDVFEIGDDGLRTVGAYAGIFLANVRRTCAESDVEYQLVKTDDRLDQVLLRFLARRQERRR